MAMRLAASSAGKMSEGAPQVTPPSVDLLKTAAAWQPALTEPGHRPPLSLICVDQATYKSPLGATSAAGKLLTRNSVLAGRRECTHSSTHHHLPDAPPPTMRVST